MENMLFELAGNKMIPVLPGGTRLSDGVRFFTLDAAAAYLHRDPAALRTDWLSYFPPISEPDDTDDQNAAGSDTGGVTAGDNVSTAGTFAAGRSYSPAEAARLEVVRIVRFPFLEAHHWRHVLNECRRRRLDPMQIWVKLRYDEKLGCAEPIVIVTIQAMRMIAQRTGLRAGETPAQWCGEDGIWRDVWIGPGRPHAARVCVLRRGIDQPFEGVATWKMHAQYHPGPDKMPVLDEFWDKGDSHMLAKCAAAIAYRAGWPDEIGDLYVNAEIPPHQHSPAPATNPGGITSGEPGSADARVTISNTPLGTNGPAACPMPDDPKFAWRLVDDTTPDSGRRLMLELMELGANSSAQAQAIIERFAANLPRLAKDHFKAFCAAVLKCVKENPPAYGLLQN